MDIKQVEPGQDWLETLNNDLSGLNADLSSLQPYQNRTYHALGLNGWKVEGGCGVIDNFPEKGKRILWISMSLTSINVTNPEGVLHDFKVGQISDIFYSYQAPCTNWRQATIGLLAVGWGDNQNEIHLHTMGGKIEPGDSYGASLFQIANMQS